MFYATFLEPDDDDDADRLELVYAGALLVQVSRRFTLLFSCCWRSCCWCCDGRCGVYLGTWVHVVIGNVRLLLVL